MADFVIFDLDGVLVDTEYCKFRAWRRAFQTIGIDISYEEFVHEWVMKGTSFSDLLRKHGRENDLREEDLRPIVSEGYFKYIDKEIQLRPGALNVLERLVPELPVGLATSSRKEYVERILRKFGIMKKFRAVACGSEVKRLKPSPDVLLLAAERMGAKPEVCVNIDDAPKGVISAKRAGMKAIAVPTRDTEFGDFYEADIVLASLEDITIDLVRMV